MAALTIGMAGITSDALAHGGHGGGGHGHSSSAGHGAGVSGVGGAAGAMRSGTTVDRGLRRGEVPAATTGAGPDTLGDWSPIW